MHDVAVRREIGILEFTIVKELVADELSADLDASFKTHNGVMKLVVSESGIRGDSGIIVKSPVGTKIIVVAGVYPYSLAISGVSSLPFSFEPEYDLEQYEKVAV
jgi:hypothetical protein